MQKIEVVLFSKPDEVFYAPEIEYECEGGELRITLWDSPKPPKCMLGEAVFTIHAFKYFKYTADAEVPGYGPRGGND